MLRQTALILMGFAMTTAAIAQSAPQALEPAQVMILGSYHFTGGGSDYVNSPVVDYLSPERQAEISVVLDRLEAFAPTRILVELQPQHEDGFNQAYRQYLAGERSLTVNERQQIGMALAARLGLDQLYGVDFASDMDFDGMLGAAQSAGQTELLAGFEAFIEPIQARMASPEEAALPVLDRLIETNSAEQVAFHDLYLLLAQMGSAENPVGAEQMEIWWGRNLHIFANIARLSAPGERVLVIYGGGHKYLFDQFVEASPNLDRVDPLTYLR